MSDERYQQLAHAAYTANGGDLKKAEVALLADVRANHEMLVALTDAFLKNAVASTLYRLAASIRQAERSGARDPVPVPSTSLKPKAAARRSDGIAFAYRDTREAFVHGDKAKQDELLAKVLKPRQRTRLNPPTPPR